MNKRRPKRSALLVCVLLLIVAVPSVLIGRGAQQERRNQALRVAIQRKNVDEAQMLLTQGADPNALHRPQTGSLWQILWRQMHREEPTYAPEPLPNSIQYALADFTDPDQPPADAEPSFRIVRLLIEAGASAKGSASMGGLDTDILSFAIVQLKNGSFKQDMIRFLIQHGAEVDGKEGTKETPLLYATDKREEQIIKILLDAGASANPAPVNDYPPLNSAAEVVSPRVLEWLLERGAKVNGTDRQAGTALMAATQGMNKSIDNAALLLARGAKIDSQDNLGETALMGACRFYNPAMIRLLLTHHPRLHIKNKEGETALMLVSEPILRDTPDGAYNFYTPQYQANRKQIIGLLRQAEADE